MPRAVEANNASCVTPNCACIDGGATLGQYTYDPFGRRLSKTVNGVTTWFHYNDTGLLAEYSASGQLLSEYQYRPGSTWMTNPLFKRDGATGKVHYYYNSHLGQPLKLFDKAGKITWAARSQAFGQTTVFVNETENNLRFPGQYEDGETGLYYNFHRYYDPATGRYLRSDPAGLSGGLNPYLYVSSSPLELIDPLGLWAIGDPLPQSVVDFSAGLGDGIIAAMTLGFVSGQDLRDAANVDGGVNPCSRAYAAGNIFGTVLGIAATAGVGAEALVARALAGTKLFRSYGGSFKAAHSSGATKSMPYRGGAFGKLDRVAGRERHHMPADSISPISRNRGPAIQMDKTDHALTSSYGSSNAAKAYRNHLASLSPRDAMAAEIRDVRRISGTQYNQAIKEMLRYAKQAGYLNK